MMTHKLWKGGNYFQTLFKNPFWHDQGKRGSQFLVKLATSFMNGPKLLLS